VPELDFEFHVDCRFVRVTTHRNRQSGYGRLARKIEFTKFNVTLTLRFWLRTMPVELHSLFSLRQVVTNQYYRRRRPQDPQDRYVVDVVNDEQENLRPSSVARWAHTNTLGSSTKRSNRTCSDSSCAFGEFLLVGLKIAL
jgi:hypothetical protein